MLAARAACRVLAASTALWLGVGWLRAAEPPVNPFGATTAERDDAVGGMIELSDGTTRGGQIYLTRDKRLQVYDDRVKRQREVPLHAVRKIECKIAKEWMEKEWRFKETTTDEKVYTGRSYPAREYVHTITLADGRTITGPLAAIVSLEPKPSASATGSTPSPKPEKFLLHKRDKGETGQELKSLVYVKRITLGPREEASPDKKTMPKPATK
jgi:hypothetical protein